MLATVVNQREQLVTIAGALLGPEARSEQAMGATVPAV
jgi:hypothetical protein